MKTNSIRLNLTVPGVKFGSGSIILWEGFSYAETGKLVKIDQEKEGAKYSAVLERNPEKGTKDLRLR